MLHLILGRNWRVNRQEILSRLAADVKNRRGGRILMVPELVSHEMERQLCACAGDTASRYAEVLSFSRLARRGAELAGSAAHECLDNGGRVVAMAAAARQLTSRLKAYASVETKPEFLKELIDGVDEFKRCCIAPEDLLAASRQTEGALSQKLEELSLLMASYDALCSRGKRDPRDQMNWLLEQLEEGTYAEKHEFYIDGFPDFTRQNLAILFCLMEKSPSVTVSLNCDCPGSMLLAFEKAGDTAQQILRFAQKRDIAVEITVLEDEPDALQPVRQFLFQGNLTDGSAKDCLCAVRADSPWGECMAAAEEIRKLVQSGMRYRDITLVCSDMTVYEPLLRLICSEMEIPLYQSGTQSILTKSMIATVLTALDASVSGYEKKAMQRYLRSAMSPLTQDETDLLENYTIIWGIRGNRWTSPWKMHPDGLSKETDADSDERLAQLNDLRERVITPLENLRKAFRKASSMRQQVLAVYELLRSLRMQERLAELAERFHVSGEDREAQILDQLWEILISALEQLHDVLGETQWEQEHFTRLLRLLLGQYEVGTIPPVLDAVQLGPVTAQRCHAQKVLLVLGVQEGSMPGYSGSNGVLTDQERVALRDLGVPLTGGAMEGIQSEFGEIYGVFCGALERICVYCSSEQPSFLYRRLSRLAGGETAAQPGLGFAMSKQTAAAGYLVSAGDVRSADSLGIGEEYRQILGKRNYTLGTISGEGIRKLYGREKKLSASQVDTQADCRMRYFLQYGLGAQERKEAAVDPAEFGTFVHWVLEHTAKQVMDMGGFHSVALDNTLSIAHEYADSYISEHFHDLESQRIAYLMARNRNELDMVVRDLWEELSVSRFQPKGFEVGFGTEGAELPPIEIPNGALKAILRGFVDRVDVWQSPGSLYYRVVDYKTGKKEFDYCDVFNGLGLQMLLYLFALEHCGKALLGDQAVGAGIQYFPARAPYLPSTALPDTESARQERSKEWKRKGLLLSDESVLQAMEPGDTPCRLDITRKKDGTVTGNLADRDQMKLLERYVFHILGKLVEDIGSGCVEANPYTRGSAHNACRFCPYGSICADGAEQGRRNYQKMSSRQFWEETAKELMEHG